MATRKFRFVSTELRDQYNCQHFTMMEGDIIELDEDNIAQARTILQMTGEDIENSKADNFVEVTRGSATVHWDEVPDEQDPSKIVEKFLVQYKTDEAIRRQANSRGIRVLELGEV